MSDGSRPEADLVAVDVLVEADGWSAVPDAAAIVEAAVRAACAAAAPGLEPGTEVAVMLTDDAHIRVLNRDWRGKDKATNVLSFPAPDADAFQEAPHLGDIAIAFETTQREAAEESKPIAHHLAHLAVHGALHLIGHDHEDGEEAEAMEATERRVLAGLGVPDPYAETEPVI